MSDPSYPLQVGLVELLKSAAGVGVADRVYDEPPEEKKKVFPYVTVGDDQVVGDDNDCDEISEVFCRIHVWSRAVGYPETKQIASAIRSRLRATAPTVTGFTVDVVHFQQIQFLRDEDGKTRHAVVEYRFLLSPAA